MNNHKYLKDRSHYEDLYDRGTVRQCLFYENLKHEHDPKLSKKENKELDRAFEMVTNISLYAIKGERYVERESTIQKWMEADRKRDEQFENAITPKTFCKFCLKEMEMFYKRFKTTFEKGEKDKVVFHFRCAECKVGRTIDEFGHIEDTIPWKCPRCTRKMDTQSKRKGKKIITKDHCKHCGYQKEDVLELGDHKPAKEPAPTEEKQFRIDKDRFCLNDKEGREYIEARANMESLSKMMKESEEKEKVADKLKKIKKLKVLEVEKLLSKAMSRAGYVKLNLAPPEVVRDVVVSFTVYDEKDRSEYDSKKDLKKLIQKTLQNTNWKLMSEGLSYSLGVLSGRLRGYQHDEDLLKLVGIKKKDPFFRDHMISNGQIIKY